MSMSPPVQYQINEKRKVNEVLGKEIDSTVQNVMRNESRYTPLKDVSRYIVGDTNNKSKYLGIQSNTMEILPNKGNSSAYYPRRDNKTYFRQDRDYTPQANQANYNQRYQQYNDYDNNYLPQSMRPYPYSEAKTPMNKRDYNYYDFIDSNKEPIAQMKNNNNNYYRTNDYSMKDFNRNRNNNYYDNNDNGRYRNNNNIDISKSSDGISSPNNKDSAYYYGHNIPQGPGLRSVPSDVYIPSYQPYKSSSTPYEREYSDYQRSRFGDYTYNYFLNSPMRGDIAENWKYPPNYYYNPKNDPRSYYYEHY